MGTWIWKMGYTPEEARRAAEQQRAASPSRTPVQTPPKK